jgi:dolichol-phosphate mannosyltransferase
MANSEDNRERELGFFSLCSRFVHSPVQTIREQQTLLKFLLVGASGTVINLLVLDLLRNPFGPIPAQASGIELSIISNFVWNDTYTFRSRVGIEHSRPYRLMKYNALSLGTAALNLAVFTLLVYLFGLSKGSWELVSSFIAILVAFFFNYFGSSRWAWKSHSVEKQSSIKDTRSQSQTIKE